MSHTCHISQMNHYNLEYTLYDLYDLYDLFDYMTCPAINFFVGLILPLKQITTHEAKDHRLHLSDHTSNILF